MPGRGLAVAVVMKLSHELPLPGNPVVTERLSPAVVEAALDEPEHQVPSVVLFYAVVDLVALLLCGCPPLSFRGGMPSASGLRGIETTAEGHGDEGPWSLTSEPRSATG